MTLQPSDVRGRVKAGTTPVPGTVELVTSGPDFETITSRVKAKYGLMVPIMRLVDSGRHLGKGPFPYADTGVVITLQADSRSDRRGHQRSAPGAARGSGLDFALIAE